MSRDHETIATLTCRLREGLQRRPLRILQPHQRKVAESNAKNIALLCGRRAGKTWTIMLTLLARAQRHPDSVLLYVALTRPSAKQILWRELRKIETLLGLGLEFHESDLEARLPNGAVIALRGANRVDEIEKFRGAHCPAIAIDEAASFRPRLLRTLVEEILEPALMDADGTLYLCGTPGAALAGYFYEATTQERSGWEVYHWTVHDNTALPHARAWIERQRQKKGWSLDHPTLRREYYGEWVRDDESLVFRGFSLARNVIPVLPQLTRPGRILSHDYGYVDSTAWCLLAHELGRSDDRHTYVELSAARAGCAPSEAADETRRLRDQYHPHIMVGDAGGLGKGYVEEYRRRHPDAGAIRPADKTRKRAYLELINDDLRTGRLLLVGPRCAGLIEELQTLQWALGAPGDVDPDRACVDTVGTNHESDALLYGWRASQAHWNRPSAEPGEDDDAEGERPLLAPDFAPQKGRRRPAPARAPGPWWDRHGRV